MEKIVGSNYIHTIVRPEDGFYEYGKKDRSVSRTQFPGTGRSSTQPCRAPAWEYDIRNNKRGT